MTARSNRSGRFACRWCGWLRMVSPVEGTPFGRYRLIELLGHGGMGEVWRAHDSDTDRVVAIKVLPAHFSDNEEFQRRFRREAHAAAGLNSPHVVPIHHYGEIDGRLYVDMRLIEGRDLASVLAEGPLEPGRAVRIIEGVALALHAAHKIGLVHRDVKPSNILLDENDFAYLIDFGIARAAGETSLTHTGGFIGSWPYMAPERFSAQEADARADVYALACVLYECLTGDTPYPGDSLEQQYEGHKATPPPQPSSTNPDLPADFDRVTEKGLAKDPDQRYATTVELANAAHDAITTPLAPPSQPTLLDDAAAATPAPAPTLLAGPTRPAPAPARRADQVRPRPPVDRSQDLFGQASAALGRGDRASAIHCFQQVVALGHPHWAPLATEQLDQLGQTATALPKKAYTSWIRRVGAAIIDAIPPLIMCIFALLPDASHSQSCVADTYGNVSCPHWGTIIADRLTRSRGDAQLIVWLFLLLILAYAIWNWGYRQGTTGSSIGKSVLKFNVVSEKTGKPIGFGRSVVRQLAHFVDAIICYIGFLFPLWDAKRQTQADKIMATVCLRV